MRKRISFEESLRSRYALMIAMDTIEANSINSFCSKLNEARNSYSQRKYLSYQGEGVVQESSIFLRQRQEKVDNELFQIEKNNFAREQSDIPYIQQVYDDEKYWRSLINPVRFHRIAKGKGSSNAPSRVETLSDAKTSNTIFDTKNIWYFLKPFVGEKSYFAYKFGPSNFFHSSQLNLWSVLFDQIHPDAVVLGDSPHNPFRIISLAHELLSGQELSKVILDHHRRVGPNWLLNHQSFGSLLVIAILKLARKELSYRRFSSTFSDQLFHLLVDENPLAEIANLNLYNQGSIYKLAY